MRYALCAGGKRVRPSLCYLVGDTLDIPLATLDPLAAALEMIHTYSLIHDDLPAMDDDDLRRGKPTVHVQFDEATAILAGDTLQSEAISLLLEKMPTDDGAKVKILAMVCDGIGLNGMAMGQSLDILHDDALNELATLERIHRLKTGALIRASALSPTWVLPTADTTRQAIGQYADEIGLMFQIVDDILDVTATSEALGKPAGSDIDNQKATYPSLLGLEGAKQHAIDTHARAVEYATQAPGQGALLVEFADWLLKRTY